MSNNHPSPSQSSADSPRSVPSENTIRNKLLVLSGKGGVGKSTVAANLALALANSGSKVGLLDVDLHGPSIPVLFGLQGKRIEATQQGKVQPFPAGKNLVIVSIGMLMADHADAIV
ncbi:MAG TPA: P-loop NTPase, partial [Opitutales bacterium]|nr:P-loop NTPase [Opitutales bacterium]